ncbi:MAG TPA: hypothetical protein VG297_17630 [Bryobacteraceae bacterium]|jgi:hypothetical protein|nr:hypothetical protein [Bryobacteraceae bacterium]
MYRLLTLALLAAAAAGAFPWFHTRPKPVILEDSPQPAATRVVYHGTAVYPRTGRLYFADGIDRLKQEQSSKSHLNWVTGSQAAKPNPPRSKSK